MFIAGPVARNKATASGSATSASRRRTPSASAAFNMAGSEARLDRVAKATADGPPMARRKAAGRKRATITAIAKPTPVKISPRAEMMIT